MTELEARVERLYEALGDRDPEAREVAEAELRGLGYEVVTPMMRLAAGGRVDSVIQKLAFAITVLATCLALTVVSSLLRWGMDFGAPILFGIPLASLAFLPISGRLKDERIRRNRQTEIAERIILSLNDPRAIGPLIGQLKPPPFASSQSVLRTLGRLLPVTDRTLLGSFSEIQRTLLFGLLRMDNAVAHRDLLISILRIAETDDSLEAIAGVRQLADSPATLTAEVAVREAARESIKRMKALATGESRVLLRPSESPGSPSEALLRPAANTVDTETDHLLRPIHTDG